MSRSQYTTKNLLSDLFVIVLYIAAPVFMFLALKEQSLTLYTLGVEAAVLAMILGIVVTPDRK